MQQNPVLERVSCAAQGSKYNVTISWKPIQGASYFYAGIFDPQNQSVAHLVVDSTNGSNVANLQNVSLDSATSYTAKVAQSDASGNPTSSYSRPYNILQNPLTELSTKNNLSSIDVSATLPTVGNPSGITVSLIDEGYNVLANENITGNSGTLTPQAPLNPSKSYTLYAAPISNGGNSQGQSDSSALVMDQTGVQEVIYDGNNLTVTADNSHQGDKLFAEWLAGENIVTSNTGGSNSVSMTKDWTTLNLANVYTVRLRELSNNSYGPASQPVEIVVAPPTLTSASFVDKKVGVRWTPPPITPTPTGGKVAAIANGQVAGTPAEVIGYQGSIDISSVGQVNSLSVQVNSKYGVAYGPPAKVDLPTAAPTITAVSVAKEIINISWNASAEAPAYRVYLNDANNKAICHVTTSDTKAAVISALDDSSAYNLTVQAYGENSQGIMVNGPMSSAVAVIPVVPVINKVSYNGSKITVNWNTLTNTTAISGYTALLLDAETLHPTGDHGSAEGADKTSADITVTLDSYKRYLVAVQATGTNTAGTLGEAVEVVVNAPRVIATEISAASITIAWTPINNPQLTGYEIAVSDNAGTPNVKSLKALDNTLSFANDLTPEQVHVTVKAVSGLSEGPASTEVNLFGSQKSYYAKAVSSTDNRPYIIRSASNQPTAADINFALTDIFTSAPATLPTAGIFALENNSASTVYPYKVTISSSSDAWKFDPTSRATLASDFLDFLKKLEKPDGSTVLIKEGALTMTRQTLALGLPLLYEETLRYMYGFNPDDQTGGYVDLVPGMRLRLDGEVFQIMPPANNQSGYVSNGASTYQIHSYVSGATPQLKTGFDAFLSTMQRTTIPSPLANVNGGGGGIIDLYHSSGRLPYYRLLYPGSLQDPKFSGLINQQNLPVLLGAPDYNTLISATEQYVNSGNFSGISGIYPFFFRGRDIPVPEIPVTINGQVIWLPLGSTVANLLETQGRLPPYVTAKVEGFTMQRAIGGLTSDVSASGDISLDAVQQNRVRLEYAISTFTPTQAGVYGLPLQIGDAVNIGAHSGN